MSSVRRTSPTQVASVVAAGLVVGSFVRPVAGRLDEVAPRPGWFAAVALLFLAGALGVLARGTWQELHEHKRVMASQHAIALLALAKAGVVVGALFLGGYGGFALSFARDWDTDLGRDRILQGGAASVASLLVLVAALLLERSLHVPAPDDEDDTPSGAAGSAA